MKALDLYPASVQQARWDDRDLRARVGDGVFTLSSMRPSGVGKDIRTSKRGWLEWPEACPHNCAFVWAIVADETLASLCGEAPARGGSKTGPPVAATATLERLPFLSLSALLLWRKQSLHDVCGEHLIVPLGRTAKSVNSFPHRHLTFLHRALFGGPPFGRAGGVLLMFSCLDDCL